MAMAQDGHYKKMDLSVFYKNYELPRTKVRMVFSSSWGCRGYLFSPVCRSYVHMTDTLTNSHVPVCPHAYHLFLSTACPSSSLLHPLCSILPNDPP